MKKRIISVGLVLAMVLIMTTTVFAADSQNWESEIDTLGEAMVDDVYYKDMQDAVDAALNSGSFLVLQQNGQTITLTDGQTLYLDLNGKTVTVTGGNVYLIDSFTDDGAVGGKLYGTSTMVYGDDTAFTVKGAIRYVILDGTDDTGAYKTANAVRVKVTQVSIRSGETSAGMYYTTRVQFNQNVADTGAKYGVVLSLTDKPMEDFQDEGHNRWTAISAAKGADVDKTGTSCLLSGIMKSDLETSDNSTNGQIPVYANGYVQLTVNNENVFVMAENTTALDYSLKTVMQAFGTNLSSVLTGTDALSGTAKKVYTFYSKWVDTMADWELTNFQSYHQRTFDLQSEVMYMGRVYETDETQWFNWSASGFSVSFKGSGLTATIVSNAPDAKNYAYLKVYVDGAEMDDILLDETTQTVTLASGLDAEEEHTVEVRKRNSPRSSTAGLVHLAVTEGEKLAKPAQKEMLIEFVGDSLTVGYSAADGATSETALSTKTEDGTQTYSKLVADALDAEYMVTAISGRGVVMNNGGASGYLFPEIYPKLDIYNDDTTDYDFSLQPDVIVINLGTNDATNSSLDSDTFQTGVENFIKLVREKNPNAHIIWAYGLRTDTMTEQVAQDVQDAVTAVNTAGDSNVHYLALDVATETHLNHPTEAGYAASATAITAKINEILGTTAE